MTVSRNVATETPAQRLVVLLDYLRLNRYIRNQQDFAERIDSDKSTISLIKHGRLNVPRNMFPKILRVFPFISAEWLERGVGEMLASDAANPEDTATFELVPLINIDSVGGMVSLNSTTPGEQYIEKMIPFTDARQGDIAIIQSGDSMSPTIPAGSVLLIRRVDDWKEYIGYGNDFVLWLDDDRRLTKQVLKYIPDPHKFITCHSYNPTVDDEELPRNKIREVWKVIKVLTDKGW